MRTIKEINTLPNELTPEAEQALLRRKDSDDEAREALILHSMKAAIRFTTKLTRGRLPLDEVFSIAGAALMRAVDKYKFKPGVAPSRLLTYSKAYLRREVSKAWRIRDPVDYGEIIPEKTGSPDLDLDTVAEETESGPDFELIHQHELFDLIRRHFNRLSETEQRVLTLQFEARLSGAAAARLMGCTRANIREARNRALMKLRHALLYEGTYDG